MSEPISFATKNRAQEEQHTRGERRDLWIGVAIHLAVLVVLGWAFPPMAVLMAGAMDLWSVVGRGSVWVRIVVAAATLFPSLVIYPPAAGFVGITFGGTVLLGFIAQRIAAWQWRFSLRQMRFTLWDLGGLTLTCGLLFAFLRLWLLAPDDSPVPKTLALILWAFYFPMCCVMAGFPVLVPPALRTARLLWWLVGIYLGVIPLVLAGLASAVFIMFDGNDLVEGAFMLIASVIFMILGQSIAALFLWLILAPMQFVGLLATWPPSTEDSPK